MCFCEMGLLEPAEGHGMHVLPAAIQYQWHLLRSPRGRECSAGRESRKPVRASQLYPFNLLCDLRQVSLSVITPSLFHKSCRNPQGASAKLAVPFLGPGVSHGFSDSLFSFFLVTELGGCL